MSIKVFQFLELDEARAHAAGGGQAIHLHQVLGRNPPHCFAAAVARGEYIAHYFDQDRRRLETMARAVGVRIIVVERAGTPLQHIDLCAGPLRKLLAMAERQDLFEMGK